MLRFTKRAPEPRRGTARRQGIAWSYGQAGLIAFKGPADHLTCYLTEGGKAAGIVRSAENQFGKLLMRDFTPRMLCVPTRKDEQPPG